jgi:hypothetical protein
MVDMTREERKAAARVMRAQVEKDRASRPAKASPKPYVPEIETEHSTMQNRQGNGPKGVSAEGGMLGRAKNAMQSNNDRMKKALEYSRQ